MSKFVHLTKKVLTGNRHFILVILFFVLHGYSENQYLIPFVELLVLFVELLVAGIIVYRISRKVFKNIRKPGIFTSAVLFIVLFFGAFQDEIARHRLIAFFAPLRYFVPFCLLLLLVFFVWLKKTKKLFNRSVLFLNSLLLLLILVDVFTITTRFILPGTGNEKLLKNNNLVVCDTCSRPPVYLVIMDEYFGSDGLKEYFHYDNNVFEKFLQEQGFYVTKNTYSNYLLSVYSIASLLNMDYIQQPGPPVISNHFGYKKAIAAIRTNSITRFFEQQGYSIANYSGFDMQGYPAGYTSGLPVKIRLITNQTMYYRVIKNLPVALARNNMVPWFARRMENKVVSANNEKLVKVLNESKTIGDKPVFTYLHLVMPHQPYAFDSSGNRVYSYLKHEHWSVENNEKSYLHYLIYTNKRITGFIQQLKLNTGGKAVIVLLSDHGYRNAVHSNAAIKFQNFNAVYLPSRQYNGWYDSVTNVNQFRILFNTLFQQQLPMLKDSLVY